MHKAVVVVGPTASGKTALAVHIAEKFDGEVISADSMQIYRGMDISTAKPTTDEMRGVPHHLIDFLDITEKYSVSDFCKDARKAFDDIISRGKLPVMAGGTGLYIDSFVSNTQFLENGASDDVRERLRAELDERGIADLYAELQRIDPEAAEQIHPNNIKRVLRALEVYRSTGLTITKQAELSHKLVSDIEPLFIGIGFKDRENLYKRINKRVDLMMENGLLKEAEEFFKSSPSDTAFKAIGCKELQPYFEGEKTVEECVEILKQSTRRYAKRQLTWFKRNNSINWLYADEIGYDGIIDASDVLIKNFLEGKQGEEKNSEF